MSVSLLLRRRGMGKSQQSGGGPLKFTNVDSSDGSISMINYGSNAPVLYYSYDGSSWQRWNYSALSLAVGQSVYIRGDNPRGFSSSSSKCSVFNIPMLTECSGEVMSLLGEGISAIPSNYCFYCLFVRCNIVSAPRVSAETLTDHCYNYMFSECTSLVEAPELPALNLADECYGYMFYACTSLTKAPELPAVTLVDDCYYQMFRGCASLVEAPELPATVLAFECYCQMFLDCTSLVTAPELPATVLANGCYYGMFRGCASLVEAPELHATILDEYCYCYMFDGCSSLIKAPELPATILTDYCYYFMFSGCGKLTEIKCFATDISADMATYYWAYFSKHNGTFTKKAGVDWPSGYSGIPEGWTVIEV